MFVVTRIDDERMLVVGKIVNVGTEKRSIVEFHHIGFVVENGAESEIQHVVDCVQVYGTLEQRAALYIEHTRQCVEQPCLVEMIPGIPVSRHETTLIG